MRARRHALSRCAGCGFAPLIYPPLFQGDRAVYLLGHLGKDGRFYCRVCCGNLKPNQREALLRAA
jgi:hypothetical protein